MGIGRPPVSVDPVFGRRVLACASAVFLLAVLAAALLGRPDSRMATLIAVVCLCFAALATAAGSSLRGVPSRMTSPWPPHSPGTRVTTASKLDKRDYSDAAQAMRRPGVSGSITHHHDSHGLCYEVRHDDGTTGCYDPDELTGADGRPLSASVTSAAS